MCSVTHAHRYRTAGLLVIQHTHQLLDLLLVHHTDSPFGKWKPHTRNSLNHMYFSFIQVIVI